MKFKKTKKATLIGAVSLLVGATLSGQASASIYAGSRLLIDSFTIFAADENENPIFPSTYSFRSTNTAQLNNGEPVVTTNNCGGTFLGSTACGEAPEKTLEVGVAEVGSSRVDDSFTYLGPGGNEYASSDSAIINAELVNIGTATQIGQIAESELQTGVQAFADSNLTSQTDYSVTFDVTGTEWGLFLVFDADPSLFVKIDDAVTNTAQARATTSATFTLTQNEGGDGSVTWAPQGTVENNCIAFGGAACEELADPEDLNIGVGTSETPQSEEAYSRLGGGDFPDQGFQTFAIQVSGLTAGQWTLNLASILTSDVTRTVPVPGTVALLGLGLLGFGGMRRKKKQLG